MKGIRIFLSAIIVLSITFTSVFGISYKKTDKVTAKEEYKGILTVWQVDGFEGGRGSRKQFLLKVARGYERENQGVLVMVSDYTLDGVKENFDKGIFPDLISYSVGTAVTGCSEIRVDRRVSGGMVGGKIYATAWARGGYVLIINPTLTKGEYEQKELQNVVISQGEYTQPLLALALGGYKVKDVCVMRPMDAYVRFVSGKTPYMVGTQRDIVRLETRGMEVLSVPLEDYNDLYQYVSVTSTDAVKRLYSERFVEYLLSDSVQNSLVDICMLSPYVDVAHQNEHLNAMQKVKVNNTVSAFIDGQTIKQMQKYSMDVLTGDQNALNKIKNLLV